ncbi:prenyltransferase [Enterococcus sp. BWR-S5]|uniref:prenyltransferase n=1 Tax=Enterococcus sp. BWR-S5 TaxID=2787714 RepID=UPI0019210A3C|nr:prenyltransferase [Enterococcus sp. BWR-S5]MBL1226920.1 prenyltransferase [Enterococcus sp. BWR-S5]
MTVIKEYKEDVEKILSHRYDLGADYWTTEDKRLIKGAPFSTMESMMLLTELGMDDSDSIIEETAKLIFSTWREDGCFQLTGKGAILPCHTVNAANTLCHMGYSEDERVQTTFQHLLATQYELGGWRCNKFSYGRGEETLYANPGPTLTGLNAFRFTPYLNQESTLEPAVELLLEHWRIKRPIGPCHYGIGTLFMQPEYPFRTYNLFYYVYVLSFYEKAKKDERFLEALKALQETMEDGKIVVMRTNNKLAKLSFCKKGEPSELATKRYQEILENLQ